MAHPPGHAVSLVAAGRACGMHLVEVKPDAFLRLLPAWSSPPEVDQHYRAEPEQQGHGWVGQDHLHSSRDEISEHRQTYSERERPEVERPAVAQTAATLLVERALVHGFIISIDSFNIGFVERPAQHWIEAMRALIH